MEKRLKLLKKKKINPKDILYSNTIQKKIDPFYIYIYIQTNKWQLNRGNVNSHPSYNGLYEEEKGIQPQKGASTKLAASFSTLLSTRKKNRTASSRRGKQAFLSTNVSASHVNSMLFISVLKECTILETYIQHSTTNMHEKFLFSDIGNIAAYLLDRIY